MATLEEGSLEASPTWAVALVCTIFVVVSLAAERGIHYVGKWLRRHDHKSLNRALEKMKEELMLLGFISLFLTVFQPAVAGICMPHSFVDHMLPCKLNKTEYFSSGHQGGTSAFTTEDPNRKLLAVKFSSPDQASRRRIILSSSISSKCIGRGKVPFLSVEALHQLHIFLFAMAIVHVIYSCLTMLLGRIKVHSWSTWEKEVHTEQFDCVKEILTLRPEFVEKHAKRPWSSSLILSWMVSFLRQFGRSLTRTDYLTIRIGFINNHKTSPKFNFHNYVNRVLQDDFKKVVGISGYLWIFVIIFLLLNVHGWHTYFWISFIPLIMVLVIGTKLQHTITTLAFEIADAQNVMGPHAMVQPRDELFWFHRPELVLILIHFILFQNAFELSFFIWNWATFGFNTCFMDNHAFVIVRLVLGVIVQILCSYSTLPLYALVTQMGTRYKAAIFQKHIKTALTDLHERVKKRRRSSKHGSVHVDGTVNSKEYYKGLDSKESSQQSKTITLNLAQGKSNAEIVLAVDSETRHTEPKENMHTSSVQGFEMARPQNDPQKQERTTSSWQKVLQLPKSGAAI